MTVATVSIDTDFARFGAKSYAINKINSVEVRERKPNGEGMILLCGLVALIAAGVSLNSIGSSTGFAPGGLVIAFIFGALAYWAWQRSKVREFMLFLMTSSSETQAFVTRDRDEVVSLRREIEAAMVRHSQGAIR